MGTESRNIIYNEFICIFLKGIAAVSRPTTFLRLNRKKKQQILCRVQNSLRLLQKWAFPKKIEPTALFHRSQFYQGRVIILNQSLLQLHLSHLIVPLGWIRYAKCPTFALPCSACKVMPIILAARIRAGERTHAPPPITQIQLHVVRLSGWIIQHLSEACICKQVDSLLMAFLRGATTDQSHSSPPPLCHCEKESESHKAVLCIYRHKGLLSDPKSQWLWARESVYGHMPP